MYLAKIENFLLSLTLLLLPTQLGKHFWQDFSYLYSLPVDYFAPTIYLWDVLVGFLVIIFFIRGGRFPMKLFTVVIVFLLSQLITINSGPGLVRLEQYTVVSLFGLYLAATPFNQLKQNLFLPLSGGLFFSSVLAIGQFFAGGTLGFWILGERTFSLSTPAIAKFDFYGQQFLRPYATFPHPNVLAGFIVVTLPLLSLFVNTLRQKLFLTITFLLAFTTLILTVSRIAIIAGVAELVFFLDAKMLKNFKLLIPLFIIAGLITPFLYARFSSTFTFDAISLFRREGLETSALELYTQVPILGVGLNNFIEAVSDEVAAGPSRFLQPVHNIFLLTLAETGTVGFIGLIYFMITPIRALFRNLNTKETQTFCLIWMVIVFLGFFDHYFLTLPQGYRTLFLIWGLSMSLCHSEAKPKNL